MQHNETMLDQANYSYKNTTLISQKAEEILSDPKNPLYIAYMAACQKIAAEKLHEEKETILDAIAKIENKDQEFENMLWEEKELYQEQLEFQREQAYTTYLQEQQKIAELQLEETDSSISSDVVTLAKQIYAVKIAENVLENTQIQHENLLKEWNDSQEKFAKDILEKLLASPYFSNISENDKQEFIDATQRVAKIQPSTMSLKPIPEHVREMLDKKIAEREEEISQTSPEKTKKEIRIQSRTEVEKSFNLDRSAQQKTLLNMVPNMMKILTPETRKKVQEEESIKAGKKISVPAAIENMLYEMGLKNHFLVMNLLNLRCIESDVEMSLNSQNVKTAQMGMHSPLNSFRQKTTDPTVHFILNKLEELIPEQKAAKLVAQFGMR